MKIAHVKAEEWDAIYVDNKLEFEGHSIPDEVWRSLIRRLLDMSGGKFEMFEADEEALAEGNGYPVNLRDVVR